MYVCAYVSYVYKYVYANIPHSHTNTQAHILHAYTRLYIYRI